MILRSFLLISLLAVLLGAKAQTVSGTITNPGGDPLAGATIALLRAPDSTIVKLQVSNEKGAYSFGPMDTGRYRVSATFVGYQTAYSDTFTAGRGAVVLPILILHPAANNLQSVVVTAQRPLVQVRNDKLILQVDGTINATGSTALEVLRKAPGVSVNGDDKITMNGKNGVQVFVDGRPLPLSGADLAAYLKTIQSAEVEAIEIITHPSARYEAAGNAGIINIRLKKNKAYGTNGSVNAGYNVGVYSKYNGGLTFNHRTARWNLFGAWQYANGTTKRDIETTRTLLDSVFDQNARSREETDNHNLRLGADFFLSKQQTLGVLLNGSTGTTGLSNNSYTVIGAASKAPDRLLLADNRFSTTKQHLDANVNYLLTGTAGQTLALNADYGTYAISGQQWQPNTYYAAADHRLLQTITYQMLTPTGIDIYSVKADYEQPLGKGRIGGGGKAAWVRTDNDFQRYQVEGGALWLDQDRSNRFVYHENINAAYLTYSQQWKALSLQAGLRAENTVMNGRSTGRKGINGVYQPYDSIVHQSYFNLFPSVALNYSRSPDHQFSLSLSRRIDRPDYQDLNPFELKVDDYLVQKGNAWLRPQYTTGIGLAWVYGQKLNTALNYSRVTDLAAWVADTIETSRSVMSKNNLASQSVWALNISYPLQRGAYSAFATVNGSYTRLNADLGAGRTLSGSAAALNAYMQHSLKFAKTWTAELTGFYATPSLQEGNMRVRSLWSVDAGVQSKLAGDRATVKLAVSDVFNSLQFRSTSAFAGQVLNYHTKGETRQLKLSLSLRLGRNEVKSARQRQTGAEEEQKRVH